MLGLLPGGLKAAPSLPGEPAQQMCFPLLPSIKLGWYLATWWSAPLTYVLHDEIEHWELLS